MATPVSALGTVSGVVADRDGALVPGAHVVLADGQTARTALSGPGGRFRFAGLPAGEYTIKVEAPGFESYTSSSFALRDGEAPNPLAITLAIPADHADVTVTASRRDLAEDEIHAEEHQRVLGIFPNFYTSFVPNPQPLDSRQKLSLALHASTDSTTFIIAGAVAGGEQLKNVFPGYGGGGTGYAKRYGAAYADGFIGRFIGSGILPSVFHQDPRYFYMGTGTVPQRARHAVLSAVLARHDTGRWEPNYSHILGNAAAGAISATYHPDSNSAGSLALSNALIGIGGVAVVNLAREFLFKGFTHGLPAGAGN